jgi:hypothetical protein
MSDISPFDAAPDPELGPALREALAPHHDGAFVTRIMARVRQQRQRGWEDELARWFWQGLVAASLATVLAGWGWTHLVTQDAGDASVAARALLDGSQPVADIVIASMTNPETP